jgi:tetratricopeptide (TPR) repeat protein
VTHFGTQKLIIGIGVVMATIYSADQFLARLEKRELDAQARHEYQNGITLLRDGHDTPASLTQAISAFERARALDRDDPTFQIGLADALIRNHQPQKAEDAVAALLERDSNNGQANLLMARAMDEEKQYSSANSYYHRAIYGTWPPNSADQQLGARVELVRWLANRGDQKGLLSELILLEPSAANTNSSIARDIPFLFRQAGAPARAIDAYHNWLRDHPGDADAYAGLGDTEIETGNFRAARQAYEKASQLKPDDPGLKLHEEVAGTALELDPTPRWLSSSEKLARSTRILNLAATTVLQCPDAQTPDSPLFQNAQKLVAEHNPAATNEAAETRLNFAETIWNTRPGSCNPPPEKKELLSVLVRKLAQ